MSTSRGVRAIAVLEATKGAIVLLAGFGVLSLLHRDVQELAGRIIQRLHLNPANKYPSIFIDAASEMTAGRLWLLAGMAMFYAVIRLVEAYGLWLERRWAEWFAVATSGIYLPIEVYEVTHGVTVIKACALLINIVIVLYLGRMLQQSKPHKAPC